jgi:hypothetical protein
LQGRRVNALGAYFSSGLLSGRFEFETYATVPHSRAQKARRSLAERAAAHGLGVEEIGPFDSERVVQFIWKIAGRPPGHPDEWQRERPLRIWLDNYSVHKSERVREELPALERAGITLHHLPSYSPELSKIEPIWHAVKHHEMKEWSHTELVALKRATGEALCKKAVDLLVAYQETVQLLAKAE